MADMRRAVTAAAALALLAGCASTDEAATPTAETSVAATLEPAPDVIGMPLDEARALVRDAGYEVEVFDSREDRSILMASNWVVTEQETDGETVRLGAEKATDGDDSDEPNEPEVTESGLTNWTAREACEEAGLSEFPYGFDPSWVLGMIAERVEGDAWFLKAEVKVENEYGNERRMELECTVGGTDSAPAVESLYVY